ncbi:MAG TPA: hypothetical protein VFZ66_12350 [Herpetosiphonaceae bacterium]
MQRFNRPRLITQDDPAYQRHVAQMLLQRANQRAIRPPSQRDLFGGEVETVVRDTLAARLTLSDRRILEYEERIGRSWQRKYRELDAVVLDGQSRIHVFEIKASRRAGALHRALRQLRDTYAILALAFPGVSASIVLVDTGIVTAEERDALAAAPDAPERLPQTLDEAIAEHDELRRVAALDELQPFPAAIEVAVLDVEALIALAGDRPLSLDWDEDEAAEAEPPPAPEEHFYSTPEDDEAESPLAAAFRKANQGRRQ